MSLLAKNSLADQLGQYRLAQQKAMEALYIQSGYKKDVDNASQQLDAYLKRIDNKYVPQYFKTTEGILLFTVKVIHDQQLTCKWSF